MIVDIDFMQTRCNKTKAEMEAHLKRKHEMDEETKVLGAEYQNLLKRKEEIEQIEKDMNAELMAMSVRMEQLNGQMQIYNDINAHHQARWSEEATIGETLGDGEIKQILTDGITKKEVEDNMKEGSENAGNETVQRCESGADTSSDTSLVDGEGREDECHSNCN